MESPSDSGLKGLWFKKEREKRMTILLLAALLPPIILLIWIYKLDKIESEPPRLILKLLLFGALSCIPAAIIESVLSGILPNIISPYQFGTLYQFVFYFLVVAWTEEGVKHFALKHGSWRNPAFNYRFDAIVYATAAALGFAAAENVMYVFQFGIQVAALRAVTAIPGHCIFGIYMGYYYGQAKHCEQNGDSAGRRRYMFLSMFMPVMLHGFYDFCATLDYALMTIVFLVYIVILDIFAFRSIKRFAREDEHIPGTAEDGDFGYGTGDPYEKYRQGTYGDYGDTTYTNWQNQHSGGWQNGTGQQTDDDDPFGIGPLSH